MKYLILCICLSVFISCKENSRKSESANAVDSLAGDSDHMKIANEKDPICGMDVNEHLSDTALINNEIWGFCSVACKKKYVESKE